MTMKRWRFYPLSLALAGVVQAAGPPLQCDVGPVTKTFGSVPSKDFPDWSTVL